MDATTFNTLAEKYCQLYYPHHAYKPKFCVHVYLHVTLNYLDSVFSLVEHLHPPDVVEDRVCGIVVHVMGDNGREVWSLGCVDASLQCDGVLLIQ